MSDGFTIDMTQPGAKEFVHLAQLKGAIKLEGMGMKHSSGRSALKFAKELYGFTGNREAVLQQIAARMEELIAEKGNQ